MIAYSKAITNELDYKIKKITDCTICLIESANGHQRDQLEHCYHFG